MLRTANPPACRPQTAASAKAAPGPKRSSFTKMVPLARPRSSRSYSTRLCCGYRLLDLPALVRATGAGSDIAAVGAAQRWVDELERPEACQRSVHQEDLDCQVGLDVRLAEEREHLAAGELFDHVAVALLHHPLEVAAHVEHSLGLSAFHHRPLDRGESVRENADDQVVEHVGLRLDRTASVVLAHERDDPVRD